MNYRVAVLTLSDKGAAPPLQNWCAQRDLKSFIRNCSATIWKRCRQSWRGYAMSMCATCC